MALGRERGKGEKNKREMGKDRETVGKRMRGRER